MSILSVSRDAQWLATSDFSRKVNVFNLDTLQHHCALPSFPHAISSIVFDPAASAMLYIGFKNNIIQIFDVEAKMFPEWSHSICTNLPKRFTQLHDSMQGLLFDPQLVNTSSDGRGSKAVYVWGSSWVVKLNLDGVMKVRKTNRKRTREETKEDLDKHASKPDGQAFEVCTRYRNILSVAFLGPKELLVVERPITDVLQTLPPAFFRPKYGTA